MADWFKCYNDELDSKGMQYAVSVQPLIPGVWLLVRSEASKNRASKFRWAGHDFEVLGFSRKLNISVEIFNQCIKMLEDMNYLKLDGEFMHILGWKKMQSDYARGVNKGYYKRKKSTKILRRVYEDSTIRREEKRREENISTSNPSPTCEGLPTEAEAITLTMTAGIPEDFTRYVHQDWFSRQGRDAGGVVVNFLPYVTKRWAREQVEWKSKTHKGQKTNENSRTNTPDRNAGTYNANASTDDIKRKVR